MRFSKTFLVGLAFSALAMARTDTLQQGVNGYTGVQDMYVVTPVGGLGGVEWGGPYGHPPTDPYTDDAFFTAENG